MLYLSEFRLGPECSYANHAFFCPLEKRSGLYEKDSPDWIPTVNMTAADRIPEDAVEEKAAAVNARYQRKLARNHLVVNDDDQGDIDQDIEMTSVETGVSCQTEVNQPLYLAMVEEIESLEAETVQLKEKVLKLSNTHKREEFEGDDEKVNYFTGLPKFSVLLCLFSFIESYLPIKPTLDSFQLMMLCLMRMRLNLPMQFLAYEFGVSLSSVSRYFTEVVNVMFERLKPAMIRWPDRDQLRKTMPMQFRAHFGTRVAVICYCFEIFIERPSNLLARASTWSTYKSNNTAKYLIGISPQGITTFISKGWGGRTSDKFVCENCGFLDNILPGDLILVDRGFDIAESVSTMCASIY